MGSDRDISLLCSNRLIGQRSEKDSRLDYGTEKLVGKRESQ